MRPPPKFGTCKNFAHFSSPEIEKSFEFALVLPYTEVFTLFCGLAALQKRQKFKAGSNISVY